MGIVRAYHLSLLVRHLVWMFVRIPLCDSRVFKNWSLSTELLRDRDDLQMPGASEGEDAVQNLRSLMRKAERYLLEVPRRPLE